MKDTTGKRERQIIIITILILTTVIKLVDINKIYRTNEIETVALEDVNLTVNKGEFLSIMGPSGCGKSTLLNIMGLLDTPTGGSIEVAGTRIESMKDKELAAFRNKKLGFVFQSFHLINSLNVLDNVELPLLYRRMSSSERKRLAQDVLAKVGLSHRMRHFRLSSPVVSASVLLLPVRLSAIRRLSLLTSRPVTWTPEWERKLWNCFTG